MNQSRNKPRFRFAPWEKTTRSPVGCATLLAVVGYLFGLPFSLFFEVDHWSQRFLIAAVPAAFFCLAGLVLCVRDSARNSKVIESVRAKLLSRTDISDSEFLENVPDSNSDMFISTRDAIAEFFDVPKQKIHADDDLRDDFRANTLEPGFEYFVVEYVIAQNTEHGEPFMFGLSGLNTLADLAHAIGKTTAEFGSNETDNHHDLGP